MRHMELHGALWLHVNTRDTDETLRRRIPHPQTTRISGVLARPGLWEGDGASCGSLSLEASAREITITNPLSHRTCTRGDTHLAHTRCFPACFPSPHLHSSAQGGGGPPAAYGATT